MTAKTLEPTVAEEAKTPAPVEKTTDNKKRESPDPQPEGQPDAKKAAAVVLEETKIDAPSDEEKASTETAPAKKEETLAEEDAPKDDETKSEDKIAEEEAAKKDESEASKLVEGAGEATKESGGTDDANPAETQPVAEDAKEEGGKTPAGDGAKEEGEVVEEKKDE